MKKNTEKNLETENARVHQISNLLYPGKKGADFLIKITTLLQTGI